jgi:tetratricopeptide (TPR) repeat protein
MAFQKKFAIAVLLPVMLLAWRSAAWADKIVLKNGRKIIAANVVEEGDKVRYETPAGQLTLPKSIVDHIEKDGFSPELNSSAATAANMGMAAPAPPPAVSGEVIDHNAVHDGSIDRGYIAKLEEEARAGSSEASERAARAHHAAAQFELARGDMEHALTEEQTALRYAPEKADFLLGVAYLHLRRSEFKKSLDYLDRAQKLAPDDPDVSKLAGWCYYGLNKIDSAVSAWKRSLALHPDPQVQAALDKATRDKEEEANYKENESAHFSLRYDGSAEPALAREVLRTLEQHFSRIESELNFTPPDSIGVVLYTQQAFSDITRAPGWAGAINDGRIRVPVQGLTGVNSDLSRVLKHELTHSFVRQKTHGRAPTWIQEGLAQWMEGKRSEQNAYALTKIYAAGHATSLGTLENSWSSFPSDVASYAYAWGLANIEYMVQTDGMQDVERILDRIGAGSSTEEALREVLHSDYGDLMDSTAAYLRKNYVQ